MIAYIEHHQKNWGGGCSIFDNDTDLNPMGIGQWFYLCGKDKPNYSMPAIPYEVDWYPDPIIVIMKTVPCDDNQLEYGCYWEECWRYPDLSGIWERFNYC